MVSILAIGTAKLKHSYDPSAFEDIITRLAEPSKALEKTKFVNRRTEIESRFSVHDAATAPLLNQPELPTISEVNSCFMKEGVDMSVDACRRAIEDWGRTTTEITHLLSTTCTSSAYPSFDHFVAETLDLQPTVRKTALTGVGCSGGLAALRLAHEIASGDPNARVLVLACEVTTSLIRLELDTMARTGSPLNIPVCLFADGASALIVGGGSLRTGERVSFEIEKASVETIPNSAEELAFHVGPAGWDAVITPSVPVLIGENIPRVVGDFLEPGSSPQSFDWFVHPGGSLIVRSLEEALSLDPSDHSRASWEVYRKRGNMSSASIGHVMEVGRRTGGRKDIVAIAFGPGINIELVQLRRPAPSPYAGARGRYLEMHEQPWCPALIREGVQKVLTKIWTTRIPVVQQIAPVEAVAVILNRVIEAVGGGKQSRPVSVVDFCSGSGGPMISVEKQINARRSALSQDPVSFLLTDLYPEPSAVPSSSPNLKYSSRSVDATNPPADLVSSTSKTSPAQIRTFCLAFHHFNETQATEVLTEGMKSADAICVFELQEFKIQSFITVSLLGMMSWLLTPFTRPSLLQLVFTYLIPIIPLIVVVDGYVSSIRTRDFPHMKHLIEQATTSTDRIEASEWTWTEGTQHHAWPLAPLFYVVGKRQKQTQTNGKH